MALRDEYLIALYRDALGEPIREVEYVSLDPGGGHAYFFKPTSTDISGVADRIGCASFPQRAGKKMLHAAARFPPLLRLVPRVGRTRLPVGESRQPDQILLSSRMRLVERTTSVVHTLPRGSEREVRAEIDARRDLPPALPVPTLLESDRSIPYFTERYIEGRSAGHPEDVPERYVRIYEMLLTLYEATTGPPQPTDIVVDRRLSELETSIDPVLEQARLWVDQEPLPTVLRTCDVHGDLHSANVLVTDDGPFFLDWENRRRDLALVDLIRPLLVQYYARNDMTFLKEMVSETGNGHEYATSYAERIGPTVYDGHEWYSALIPLGCLCLLEEMKRGTPMWNTCYDLLENLVKER
ncbi:phosphotransferase [Halorubrum sp. JWXQ-INN 858]|uniref:phosphotransferase n=1 Tax=Halorubrum sp. JWXQ-INN 858 TaxID=2690782 RepID=UPI0013570A32|nr:phosphotransferase [Halorubrum sp. JWXQ-INN 858]MWV64980.1 phosphotransferase [Halorubrum sp. JWXQ-INN 858]